MSKKVIIIDNEPGWKNFCESLGFPVVGGIDGIRWTSYKLVIIGSRLIHLLPLPIKTIVATSEPSTKEAIKSYRLKNVTDYITKDLREDIIRKVLK